MIPQHPATLPLLFNFPLLKIFSPNSTLLKRKYQRGIQGQVWGTCVRGCPLLQAFPLFPTEKQVIQALSGWNPDSSYPSRDRKDCGVLGPISRAKNAVKSHVPSCPSPPITHCRRSCRPSFHTNGLFSSVTDSTGPLETREREEEIVSVRARHSPVSPPFSHIKSE